MRPLNEIIVHCTATRSDWWTGTSAQVKTNEVRNWHTSKGWSDIGYHYLIDRDGTVVSGRPLERTGAHVKGHNTGTIGISLFGGHGGSASDMFEDNFTEEQDAALRKADCRSAKRSPVNLQDQRSQRVFLQGLPLF